MNHPLRQLRTPEERVGMLPNASLPPPAAATEHASTSRTSDDELLLRALVARDDAAFAVCLDRFYAPMLRLALQHVHRTAAAEEVVQETWLAALEGITRFEHRASVKTWLFHILRNIARRRGRRDARVRPLSDVANPDTGRSTDLDTAITAHGTGHAHAALWTSHADPERDVLDDELARRIDAAIATLPPRMREVLVLRDVEGLTAAEVCNILDLSDTNQRVILHRARDRMRKELRDYLRDDVCEDDHDVP